MNHRLPFPAFDRLLHTFYKHAVYKRHFKRFGNKAYLSPMSRVENMERISIGDRAKIMSGAWLSVLEGHTADPQLVIDDGTYLGHGCVISCVNDVHIGKQVTIGDNVQLGDTTHHYQTLGQHVLEQGLAIGRLKIGDRAWIGRNSFVGYDLEIGEHAVVGANSVVGRSVPAFTVVAGSPAKPIKRYDHDARQWVRIGTSSTTGKTP